MKSEKYIALMPMKANSQRVPGKNFRPLGQKVLYLWMLETLLDVADISMIVINTDADELLQSEYLSTLDRVLVRERPESLRGDDISMNNIIRNDLDCLAGSKFLMTHSTNPFIEAKTIKTAIFEFEKGLENGNCDSLFSVNKHQTRFYRGDCSPINHDPNKLAQTQDLDPWFEENSCLYLFTRSSFLSTSGRVGLRPTLFETPKLQSIDIDTVEDWNVAEVVAAGMRSISKAQL
ncbi:acylneuraminate cytidylyltransferase family protein [Luminiphilus sp.]|nr:acylneuraminate cytidylyltransferase family protein [Luminiphilus sp.]MDA8986209.1 acylneuraminate cytidylyltransferase family protein [Luminiphilus sp.]